MVLKNNVSRLDKSIKDKKNEWLLGDVGRGNED